MPFHSDWLEANLLSAIAMDSVIVLREYCAKAYLGFLTVARVTEWPPLQFKLGASGLPRTCSPELQIKR